MSIADIVQLTTRRVRIRSRPPSVARPSGDFSRFRSHRLQAVEVVTGPVEFVGRCASLVTVSGTHPTSYGVLVAGNPSVNAIAARSSRHLEAPCTQTAKR